MQPSKPTAEPAEHSLVALYEHMDRTNRWSSLMQGVLLMAMSVSVASFLLPLATAALDQFVPRPSLPVAILSIICLVFGPSVSITLFCLTLPLLLGVPIWIRFLLGVGLLAIGFASILLANWCVGHRIAPLIDQEVFLIFPALLGGAAMVALPVQQWLGWTLCERDCRVDLLPTVRIRDLFELTLISSVIFVLLRSLSDGTDQLFVIAISAGTGMVATLLGLTRVVSLSPNRLTRRLGSAIATFIVFLTWYALGVMSIWGPFGFNFLNAMLLLIPASLGTVVFFVSTALPISIFRQLGWRWLRRSAAKEPLSAS